MKTDFVVIGAQKCGTTSLASQLALHPEVCFCSEKEPHFFSMSTSWGDQIDTYHSLFDPRPGQLCGEASTSYTFYPEFKGVPERLFSYNPEMRLIYILRDPFNRMVSHYQHRCLRGREDRPFVEAVFRDKDYVNRSKYWMQIQQFLSFFSRDQVFVWTLESLVTAPLLFWTELSGFLGIELPSEAIIRNPAKNVTSQRKRLKGMFSNRVARGIVHRLPGPVVKAFDPLLYSAPQPIPRVSGKIQGQLWNAALGDDVSEITSILRNPDGLDPWRKAHFQRVEEY